MASKLEQHGDLTKCETAHSRAVLRELEIEKFSAFVSSIYDKGPQKNQVLKKLFHGAKSYLAQASGSVELRHGSYNTSGG